MFGVGRAELVVIPEVRGPAVRFTSMGELVHALSSTSELTFAEQEVLNELRATTILTGPMTNDCSLGLALAERSPTPGRWSSCVAATARRACSCSSTPCGRGKLERTSRAS